MVFSISENVVTLVELVVKSSSTANSLSPSHSDPLGVDLLPKHGESKQGGFILSARTQQHKTHASQREDQTYLYPMMHEVRTAILVDGGFYKRRAHNLFGDKSPQDRADELITYCCRHLKGTNPSQIEQGVLYRIIYYDCRPPAQNFYNPVLKKPIDFSKTDRYKWSERFLELLACKRKVALHLGDGVDFDTNKSAYRLTDKATKQLLKGTITVDQLTTKDIFLDIVQKGVDMRIGLDIATLSSKRLVDRIVLISGDSDFVPAAKYARREGVDFILDPMWQDIKPSLNIHIDGLHSCTQKNPTADHEPLCVKPASSRSVS